MPDRRLRRHWATCPGCAQRVELLPPRDKGPKGGRVALPWRRKSHYLPRTSFRCRAATYLTPDEIPEDQPT